jgi:pimeloyl-ACP methyl ester carboxylesterase
MNEEAKGRYAQVNGLRMYYEVHGSGKPLVVLHGGFGWATVHPILAEGHQVIAVEQQGHGHTADIDRPLTYDHMADDTAALLEHLKIDEADFFGYSMGGNVGLALAIRHPPLVRKLAINGSYHGKLEDAFDSEGLRQFKDIPPDFAPPVLKDPYDRVAPDPTKWPTLVAKIKAMGLEFQGFGHEDLRAIQARVLITLGDRDMARVEHAVELYRLIPNAQLAVFPGADHFLLWQHPEKLLPTIAAFFDQPEH